MTGATRCLYGRGPLASVTDGRWGRAVGTRWLSPLLQRPRATVASEVPAQRLIGHSHGVSGCHCYMLAVERARAILCQHRHSIALSLALCVICLTVVATRTLRVSPSLSRLVSHLSGPPVFQVCRLSVSNFILQPNPFFWHDPFFFYAVSEEFPHLITLPHVKMFSKSSPVPSGKLLLSLAICFFYALH